MFRQFKIPFEYYYIPTVKCGLDYGLSRSDIERLVEKAESEKGFTGGRPTGGQTRSARDRGCVVTRAGVRPTTEEKEKIAIT